jgi:hypothetical protein
MRGHPSSQFAFCRRASLTPAPKDHNPGHPIIPSNTSPEPFGFKTIETPWMSAKWSDLLHKDSAIFGSLHSAACAAQCNKLASWFGAIPSQEFTMTEEEILQNAYSMPLMSPLPDEYFVLQMDGRLKSHHRRFVDALRAALLLRDQFPHHDIKCAPP